MIKNLVRLSDHLDFVGLEKEADYLDAIIKEADDVGSPIIPSKDEGVEDAASMTEIGSLHDFRENIDYLVEQIKAGVEAEMEARRHAEEGADLDAIPEELMNDPEFKMTEEQMAMWAPAGETDFMDSAGRNELEAIERGNRASEQLAMLYDLYLGTGATYLTDKGLEMASERGHHGSNINTDPTSLGFGQRVRKPIAEASELIKELIKTSDLLDRKGMSKESDLIDKVITLFSGNSND